MQLYALSLQPSGAHSAEAKTTRQKLQPDGCEQGGGLEGTVGAICIPGLAALLLHARYQHHNLVECLQPQLEIKHIPSSQVVSHEIYFFCYSFLLIFSENHPVLLDNYKLLIYRTSLVLFHSLLASVSLGLHPCVFVLKHIILLSFNLVFTLLYCLNPLKHRLLEIC